MSNGENESFALKTLTEEGFPGGTPILDEIIAASKGAETRDLLGIDELNEGDKIIVGLGTGHLILVENSGGRLIYKGGVSVTQGRSGSHDIRELFEGRGQIIKKINSDLLLIGARNDALIGVMHDQVVTSIREVIVRNAE